MGAHLGSSSLMFPMIWPAEEQQQYFLFVQHQLCLRLIGLDRDRKVLL